MQRIIVVGMGETGRSAKQIEGIKVACNDTNRVWPDDYDYTFTVDPPTRFSIERRNAIIESPGLFATTELRWENHRKVDFFVKSYEGKLNSDKTFYEGVLHQSIISPYMAVQFAWGEQANAASECFDIILCGVDMVTHHMNGDHQHARIVKDFKALKKELYTQGCGLYISEKYGILQDVLPVYDNC